ncbi:MAG: CHAT domain-containing protein [Alphaproteobacteria bacterium]|nr:CHAT domain-containing protein [Alphaproteobacteria bacterium]
MPGPTVLLTWFNDARAQPLNIDPIVDRVEQELADGPLCLKQQINLGFSQIAQLIRAHRPRVFQFLGHGTDQGRLVMRNDEGERDTFPADAVAAAITADGHVPELVVIGACHGRRVGEALRARGVPYVIATTQKIPDASLQALSQALYSALMDGADYVGAYEAALTNVRAQTEGQERYIVLLRTEDAPVTSLVAPRPLPHAARPASVDPGTVTQIVLWLDVDHEQPTEAEVQGLLPVERRERLWFRLSEHGGPRVDRDRHPHAVPWPQLGRAIAKLRRAVAAARAGGERSTHYFVVGCAPLAAFTQLGVELSSWGPRITHLNRRRGSDIWDRLELNGPAGDARPYFTQRIGFEGRHTAQGLLGLYVACRPCDFHPDARVHLEAQTERPKAGELVLCPAEGFQPINADNGATVLAELVDALSSLSTHWPATRGLRLYINGPATLALMVGLALNPRIHPDTLATYFVKPDYRDALPLPWRDRALPELDLESAEGRAERLAVLIKLRDSIEAFRARVTVEQLRPSTALAGGADEVDRLAARLHRRLLGLRVLGEPGPEAFSMRIYRRELQLGAGLLEGLRSLSQTELEHIAPLFVLHELVHGDQGPTSRVYRGVGRAGVVVEEIDYQADCFALAVWLRNRVERGGPEARESAHALLAGAIQAHLKGLAAFDRMEQGERMEQLPERRLRRYLIWALQRARAESIRGLEDAERLLADRLFVELTPLRGTLSGRFDKVATGPTEHTELFIALNARLCRLPTSPLNFEPAQLLERVRSLDVEGLTEEMRTVLELAPGWLAAWVE